MSDTNTEQLGRLLRQHRHEAGLSMEEAAKAAGIDKSTLSRFEQGLIDSPDPNKLTRIASALGTEVEDYHALAGYATAHGMPTLLPYMRVKYDATEEEARDVENYFTWLRQKRNTDDQSSNDRAA